jgi:hypothetical protein
MVLPRFSPRSIGTVCAFRTGRSQISASRCVVSGVSSTAIVTVPFCSLRLTATGRVLRPFEVYWIAFSIWARSEPMQDFLPLTIICGVKTCRSLRPWA